MKFAILTIWSVQFSSKYMNIVVQPSELFKSCKTEIPYPWNNPQTHHFTFCLYELVYSRYFIEMDSHSICLFVIHLFHVPQNFWKHIKLCQCKNINNHFTGRFFIIITPQKGQWQLMTCVFYNANETYWFFAFLIEQERF